MHRPRTALGDRLNQTATSTFDDVDCCVLLLEASAPIGAGDRYIAERLRPDTVIALNKVDRVGEPRCSSTWRSPLPSSGSRGAEYFPVSAKTGEGVPALVEYLAARMPEGPRYFPAGMVSDVPEAFYVAELVREQLLENAEEELPHSIACRVTEWEWPRIRCEILVERESQKGIVIGKGGRVLKAAGTAVRQPARSRRLPRAVREGREGLAAPPGRDRAPRATESRVGSAASSGEQHGCTLVTDRSGLDGRAGPGRPDRPNRSRQPSMPVASTAGAVGLRDLVLVHHERLPTGLSIASTTATQS